MLAKPNNKVGRGKSRGGFSPREIVLKFNNSFSSPTGEEKLSSYSTAVKLIFKRILFTCLALPLPAFRPPTPTVSSNMNGKTFSQLRNSNSLLYLFHLAKLAIEPPT